MIVVKEKKRRHALMLLIKFCPREAKFFQNKIKIYASAARPNSVLVGTFVYYLFLLIYPFWRIINLRSIYILRRPRFLYHIKNYKDHIPLSREHQNQHFNVACDRLALYPRGRIPPLNCLALRNLVKLWRKGVTVARCQQLGFLG